LCALFDRLYVQEHKIEKVEQDVSLSFWCVVVTIFLAVLGAIISSLRLQKDTIIFILFVLFAIISMGFIILIFIRYLNDSKK